MFLFSMDSCKPPLPWKRPWRPGGAGDGRGPQEFGGQSEPRGPRSAAGGEWPKGPLRGSVRAGVAFGNSVLLGPRGVLPEPYCGWTEATSWNWRNPQ